MNLEKFTLRGAALMSVLFVVIGVYFGKWDFVVTWVAVIAMIALDEIVSDRKVVK